MKKTILKDLIRFTEFLKDNKALVGLADYTIYVDKKVEEGNNFAEVNVDMFEKTLDFKFNKKFFLCDEKRRINILFHELVHARICVYRQYIEEHMKVIEEHLVNDLVRGFERHNKFKLK